MEQENKFFWELFIDLLMQRCSFIYSRLLYSLILLHILLICSFITSVFLTLMLYAIIIDLFVLWYWIFYIWYWLLNFWYNLLVKFWTFWYHTSSIIIDYLLQNTFLMCSSYLWAFFSLSKCFFFRLAPRSPDEA